MPNSGRYTLENDYTMIANEILEGLAKTHIRPDDWCVLIFIIRKTYGYHKKVDYISNWQIAGATSLHKSTVSHSLKRLEQAGLITCREKLIGLQTDSTQWKLIKSSTSQKLEVLSTKKLEVFPTKLEVLSTGLEVFPTKVGSISTIRKIKDKRYIESTVKKEKLEVLSTQLEKELITILERLPYFARDRPNPTYNNPVAKLREIISDYPGLDYRLELKKFVEYWSTERRKLKKPWLALRNWLERAQKGGMRITRHGGLMEPSSEKAIAQSIEET